MEIQRQADYYGGFAHHPEMELDALNEDREISPQELKAYLAPPSIPRGTMARESGYHEDLEEENPHTGPGEWYEHPEEYKDYSDMLQRLQRPGSKEDEGVSSEYDYYMQHRNDPDFPPIHGAPLRGQRPGGPGRSGSQREAEEGMFSIVDDPRRMTTRDPTVSTMFGGDQAYADDTKLGGLRSPHHEVLQHISDEGVWTPDEAGPGGMSPQDTHQVAKDLEGSGHVQKVVHHQKGMFGYQATPEGLDYLWG